MSPFLQFLLDCIGLNPLRHKKPKYNSLLIFAAGLSCTLLEIDMLLGVILNWEGVVTMAIYVFAPAFIVLVAQFYNMWLNADELKHIITSTDLFWTLDKFGKEFEAKMNTIINYARLYCFAFAFAAAFVVSLMCVAPFLTGVKEIPFNGYDYCDLEIPECFHGRLWSQAILTYIHWIPIAIGSDCTLIYCISRGYVSFEMIKHGLQKLDISSPKCHEEISDIAQQHYLTTRFVKDIDAFFHYITALQFLSSMGNLVFSLYMLTSEGMPPPTPYIFKFGILYMVYFMQLLAICVAGGILAEQTMTIAHEAFYTNWWIQTNPSARKGLAFIIQVSQKGDKLTVGKVMELNLASFLAVVKNSLSMYMLLKTFEASDKLQGA